MLWGWLIAIGSVLFVLIVIFQFMRWYVAAEVTRARRTFPAQKDLVQNEFYRIASASGKPRGVRWKELQWGQQTEFLRHRQTAQICVLIGVTIRFEAVEGSDMVHVEAVNDPKNATAMFVYHQGQWHPTEKAIFNLNPDEAAEQFEEHYERLGT